jgi:hypothetical protein
MQKRERGERRHPAAFPFHHYVLQAANLLSAAAKQRAKGKKNFRRICICGPFTVVCMLSQKSMHVMTDDDQFLFQTKGRGLWEFCSVKQMDRKRLLFHFQSRVEVQSSS